MAWHGADEASLGDLHYKCIMQAWSNKTNPKQVHGMVKHHQKWTQQKPSTHATLMSFGWSYTTHTICMQNMTKPAMDRAKEGPKSHKNRLEPSLKNK